MAGQTVGSLLIRIGADISGLNKSLDKAERSMMKFSGKMENIGRTLSTTLTLPILGAGAAALKAAADYETLEVSFQTLLKSAEKGSKFFADLKEFAAKTPFEMKEVAAAAKVMLGYGFSAEETNKQLQVLGDVAAATGGDVEGLSVIMGQGAALGKFMTVDLKQLAMRGIPILDELGKQLGVTASEVMEMAATSQISYPMVAKAIEDMTKNGGPYFNAMQNQSKTLGGLFSTLKDTAVQGFAAIGMSIKETLKLDEVVVRFTEKIQGLTRWFENLTDGQRKTIVVVAGVLAAIGPLLVGIATMTKVAATAVIGFKGLLTGITAIASPVGLVVVAIAALAAGIVYAYKKNEQFREQVDRIGAALSDAGKKIVAIWSNVKDLYGAILKRIWELTKPIFTMLGQALGALAMIWLKVVAGFWEAVGKLLDKGLNAIDQVKDKITELQNSKVGKAIGWIKDTATSAGESVMNAVVSPFKALNNLLGESEKKRGAYHGMVKGQVEAEKTAVDDLGGAIQNLSNGLYNVNTKIGKATNKIKGIVGAGDQKYGNKVADFAFVGENRKVDTFGPLKKDIPQVSSLLSGLNVQLLKVRDTVLQGGSGIARFVDNIATGIQGFADMFGEVIGTLNDTVQQFFANQAAAIDANYEKQRAAIEGSRMTEEAKQKAIQQLDEATDKKKRALMRKQAVREKIMALFQAAINTAGAIINALKTDPTGILAAIVGSISAVQIGLIAGAKIPALAQGGLAYGPQLAMVGDNPGARVNPEVIAPLDKLESMIGKGGPQRIIVEGRISGKDILLSSERANNDRIRTRGY